MRAIQARGAWFRTGDEMLSDFIHSHPRHEALGLLEGERTGRERTGRDDWMLLIEAGEVGEEEAALILAQWLKLLGRTEAFICTTHDNEKGGIGSSTETPTWEALCKRYDQQAALLGDIAVRSGRALKKYH